MLFVLLAVVAFYGALLVLGLALLAVGMTAGAVAITRRSRGRAVRPWLLVLTSGSIALALVPLAPSVWWFTDAASQTFLNGR